MNDLNAICDRIFTLQRVRRLSIKSQQQIDRQTDAFIVSLSSIPLSNDASTKAKWRDDDKKVLKAAFKEAREFRRAVEKGKTDDIPETFQNLMLINWVESAKKAREHCDKHRQEVEKNMRQLAESLPVWSAWAETIKGFSSLGLAIIVGEARNLSNYPDVRNLYKRLGLGVMDGDIRQGGLPKSASREEWIEHGYNRQRRAQIWVMIDDIMLKNQARGVKQGAEIGPYARIYYERKEKEIAHREDRSDGHLDKRARRYMTKKFIRDLFHAWKICDAEYRVIEETLKAAAD